MGAILLSMLCVGQPADYVYRPTSAYVYRPPVYYWWLEPRATYWVQAPVFWVWTNPRTYKNRPRQISPGHREKRLAWERKPLSEAGRQDQLRDIVRRLYAGSEGNSLLAAALEERDPDRLRQILMIYKTQVRQDDPAWGALW